MGGKFAYEDDGTLPFFDIKSQSNLIPFTLIESRKNLETLD